MTSVDFLVAYGAVLEPGRAQVMKRGRNATKYLPCVACRIHSYIGVTLQAHKTNLMPGEHSRICRSMRLMAPTAAFKPHRRVLECEGSSLVCVAAQAARLVRGVSPNLLRTKSSMWIVAVDTRHRALRQSVSVRSLKLRPGTQVATGALRVDLRRLVRPQRRGSPVNGVAPAAGNLSFGVPALDTTGVSRLIQMASQADLIRLTGAKLDGISNVFGGSRFGVLAGWTMAGL